MDTKKKIKIEFETIIISDTQEYVIKRLESILVNELDLKNLTIDIKTKRRKRKC